MKVYMRGLQRAQNDVSWLLKQPLPNHDENKPAVMSESKKDSKCKVIAIGWLLIYSK